MNLSIGDYILLAGIGLPLVAASLAHIAGVLNDRKMTALARIAGMAGRLAADVAVSLKALPPGADRAAVKAALVQEALPELQASMAASIGITGADAQTLGRLVSREASKLELLPAAVAPALANEFTPLPSGRASMVGRASPVVALLLLLLTGVGLVGCVAASPEVGPGVVTPAPGKAALYCGIVTAYGPLTVALISAADPQGAAVAVTSKTAVDAACARAGGVAVSPPPPGVVAPRVAVAGPVDVVAR